MRQSILRNVRIAFLLVMLLGLVVSCLEIFPPWSSDDDCVPVTEDYDRDLHYGSWIDADQDGQDTREEVLEAENQGSSANDYWYCPYTDQIISNSVNLDIDHLVPLKESWVSGACYWTQSRRVSFANHLDDPNHLIAVHYSANRQKGSKDPTEWVPANNNYLESYLSNWLVVKKNWNLAMDEEEKNYFQNMIAQFPGLSSLFDRLHSQTSELCPCE